MSLVSLLDWKEKWMGLYDTNHFADKEECACKQDFRKIQKKYRSIYINGFWVLKRKITYYSLCQRESAVSRGHEWLRQRGEEVSHNELPFINFWVMQCSSYQPEGWDVHGGQSPSFYLKRISTNGLCPLKDGNKRAQNVCKQTRQMFHLLEYWRGGGLGLGNDGRSVWKNGACLGLWAGTGGMEKMKEISVGVSLSQESEPAGSISPAP